MAPVRRYHYSLGSALGYALSMFSETLRDRKLVTLEQDLAILLFTFLFPSLEARRGVNLIITTSQ